MKFGHSGYSSKILHLLSAISRFCAIFTFRVIYLRKLTSHNSRPICRLRVHSRQDGDKDRNGKTFSERVAQSPSGAYNWASSEPAVSISVDGHISSSHTITTVWDMVCVLLVSTVSCMRYVCVCGGGTPWATALSATNPSDASDSKYKEVDSLIFTHWISG